MLHYLSLDMIIMADSDSILDCQRCPDHALCLLRLYPLASVSEILPQILTSNRLVDPVDSTISHHLYSYHSGPSTINSHLGYCNRLLTCFPVFPMPSKVCF